MLFISNFSENGQLGTNTFIALFEGYNTFYIPSQGVTVALRDDKIIFNFSPANLSHV